MPTKLQTEIITAAIADFEEQKKRLNAQIAELRQMLNPSANDGRSPAPVRRRTSTAARARIAAPKGRDGSRPEGKQLRLSFLLVKSGN